MLSSASPSPALAAGKDATHPGQDAAAGAGLDATEHGGGDGGPRPEDYSSRRAQDNEAGSAGEQQVQALPAPSAALRPPSASPCQQCGYAEAPK